MADNFKVTVDGKTVAAEIEAAANRISREVRAVVAKGALNVKNAMRQDAERSRHFKVAPSISYGLTGNAFYSEAEIGPEHRGVGNLANIAYFGGASGGGGTIRDPQRAADEEAPRFEQALLRVIDELL